MSFRLRLSLLALVAVVAAVCATAVIRPPIGVILYAQALPATVHASWTPNVASDAVTQYQVTLDAGPAAIILPAACTATLCTSAAVSVAAYGAHVLTLRACNLKIGTDPTTLQCSATLTLPFTLNAPPGAIAGGAVTN